ncbi:FtsX-like permease family protein [Micromonospora auratinigra]|uniref:Putative ABC transport system permease protein n=1 Tax=Micromonospora auratinigra TaxID=261654 RepID=A0A1A8YZ81_9ACTN|nr:FtsX-like permease family protein [Micromonospora auratinigra]SBT36914.1 putative ABC transport system permease protein [Micromonospora auratinigra]
MSVFGAVRRVRAYGGHFLLLAVLTLVTALLITAVPRVADRLTGQGLREYVAAQPVARRDLTYATQPEVVPPLAQRLAATRALELATLERRMPTAVQQVIGERWYAAQTYPARLTGPRLAADKGLIDLGLRSMTGMPEAATLVAGRWPEQGVTEQGAIEVALADSVAGPLGVTAGDRFRLAILDQNKKPITVREMELVGVFTPRDRRAGIWDSLPGMLGLTPPEGDGDPFVAVGYTAEDGFDAAATAGFPVSFSWRYRIAPAEIAAGQLSDLIGGLAALDRARPAGLTLTQGVDIPLRRFAESLAAARTLLAVIAAGLLATLAGLTLLAARLAARRRATEYALIRARGGSTVTVLRRGLTESVLVLPLAAGAGWLLGGRLPGAGTGLRWVLLAGLLATLVPPLAALTAGRGTGGRTDLVGARATALRRTVEVTVLVIAALGAFLLRRRGLTLDGTVDPLLVSVPVLLAVAAALLALRAYPWPLRLLSRAAARARGSVAFLGTARAGRAATTGPLVVVVLAIATAAFCGVVAAGIETGRDRAAARAVPGDVLVVGERFAPDTTEGLAGLPGVRAVTPLLTVPGERPYADRAGRFGGVGETRVLLVDGARFADVARRAGVAVPVPDLLRTPGDGTGGTPLPALVSPALAAEFTAAGLADRDGRRPAWLDVQGNRLPVRTAAVVAGFPLVDQGVDRFLVLPWPALPADAPNPLAPTGFVLAGDRVDPAAVARVVEEGQRRYQRAGTVNGGDRPRQPTVLTRSAVRAELGGSGVNGLLVFGFTIGAVGGGLLGLLALAFAVLAGARARGQVLSRLRTMGLSRGQWRGLLLVELTPLVLVSVLTGAVVGALLPVLLTPVLGLPAFTGGVAVPVRFEPGLVAGVLGLALLALGFAVAVEALNNRRLRLGEVLRLGEES